MPKQRWLLVDKISQKPVSKTSYPNKKIAAKFADDTCEPKQVNVIRKSGPFSDYLELDDKNKISDNSPSGLAKWLLENTKGEPDERALEIIKNFIIFHTTHSVLNVYIEAEKLAEQQYQTGKIKHRRCANSSDFREAIFLIADEVLKNKSNS